MPVGAGACRRRRPASYSATGLLRRRCSPRLLCRHESRLRTASSRPPPRGAASAPRLLRPASSTVGGCLRPACSAAAALFCHSYSPTPGPSVCPLLWSTAVPRSAVALHHHRLGRPSSTAEVVLRHHGAAWSRDPRRPCLPSRPLWLAFVVNTPGQVC